jgi:hypothetical protein
MKTKDGGPAFPLCGTIVKQYQPTGIVTGESLQGFQAGMSLRDYFATHAKESDVEYYMKYKGGDNERTVFLRTREEAKYAYADAMLEAREKWKRI